MPDHTLAVVGSIALTEGIKFLYGQTSEILKRWRERKDKAQQGSTAKLVPLEPVQLTLPAVFQGQLENPTIHFDAVQQTEEALRDLRKGLVDYVEGVDVVDPSDGNLLAQVDALRKLLETVYDQRLTFKGEERPPSGPLVVGHIDVEQVLGEVTAVSAKDVKAGVIRGSVKTDRVESGGKVVGVKVEGTIGGPE